MPDTQGSAQRAKLILSRLTDAFPHAEVQALRLPTDLAVTQILEGTLSATTTESQAGAAASALTAEYVIRTET